MAYGAADRDVVASNLVDKREYVTGPAPPGSGSVYPKIEWIYPPLNQYTAYTNFSVWFNVNDVIEFKWKSNFQELVPPGAKPVLYIWGPDNQAGNAMQYAWGGAYVEASGEFQFSYADSQYHYNLAWPITSHIQLYYRNITKTGYVGTVPQHRIFQVTSIESLPPRTFRHDTTIVPKDFPTDIYPFNGADAPSSSNLGAGVIASIVIGAVAGITLVVALVVFLLIRRRRAKASNVKPYQERPPGRVELFEDRSHPSDLEARRQEVPGDTVIPPELDDQHGKSELLTAVDKLDEACAVERPEPLPVKDMTPPSAKDPYLKSPVEAPVERPSPNLDPQDASLDANADAGDISPTSEASEDALTIVASDSAGSPAGTGNLASERSTSP